MTTPSDRLEHWLARLPSNNGITEISTPRTFGNVEGEAEYTEQFVVDDDYVRRVSRGLELALKGVRAPRDAPALELGCGTGIFSRALIEGTGYPTYYISDMSPAFLELTRDAMGVGADDERVRFVVLDTADIAKWPPGSLALVSLRFVLHHVLDWERFIHEAAALLRPGGVLIFEEPCSDGYLLQVMMVQVARQMLQGQLSEAVEKDLDFFVGLTTWYLRTGVDKTESEDKHVFRVSNVIDIFRQAGLTMTFHPNRGFDALGSDESLSPTYFLDEFRHNFAVNFGFGPETMAFFETHLAPPCEHLFQLSGDHMGPYVKGVYIGKKGNGLADRVKGRAKVVVHPVSEPMKAQAKAAARRLPSPIKRRLRSLASKVAHG